MGAIALGAVGLAAGAGGAFLGSQSAKKHKRALTDVANTPNVDLNDVYSQSSLAGLMALPQFQSLSRQGALGQQQAINEVQGEAIPGFEDIQSQRSANVLSNLRGELSPELASQIWRETNARNLGGGQLGQRGNYNQARNYGRTAMDLQNLGQTQASNLIASTPTAKTMSPLEFLISPQNHYGALLGERAQKMDLMAQVAGAPTSTDIWAKYLTDSGGAITGAASGFGGG